VGLLVVDADAEFSRFVRLDVTFCIEEALFISCDPILDAPTLLLLVLTWSTLTLPVGSYSNVNPMSILKLIIREVGLLES